MVMGRRDRTAILKLASDAPNPAIAVEHPEAGERWLHCEGSPELLFTENETNARRLFGAENSSSYLKDGINDYVIHGAKDAVLSSCRGCRKNSCIPLPPASSRSRYS